MTRGRIDQPLVDEALGGRVTAAAFADGDSLGLRRQCNNFRIDQRVVKNDVGTLEQACRPQRQKIGRTGTGANQINNAARAGHLAAAATVASTRRRNSGSGRSTDA